LLVNYLTLCYILALVLKCYWTALSNFYTCVFWNYFRENIFSTFFPSDFSFSVWSVWTSLVIHPDGEPYRVILLFPLPRRTPFFLFSLVWSLCLVFLELFSHAFLTCSCSFVVYLNPRYVSLPFFMFLFNFHA